MLISDREIEADPSVVTLAVQEPQDSPPAPVAPIGLVVLSNLVPAYRVTTFQALARKVRQLSVLITSEQVAEGARGSGIDIRSVPSLHIPAKRLHRNGFVENYTVHLPYGVLASLRRLRPDCVFAVELGPRTLAAALFKLLWRCPLVIHADLSEETEIGRGRLRHRLRKTLLKFADRVLVNGESGARYVTGLGYPRSKIAKLPYATDQALFRQPERSTRQDSVVRMLYVGQLIERKGLEPFILALAEHLRNHPAQQAKLTLVGDGDRRDAIAALATPPNLQVTLTGPVPYADLPSMYADADLFVLPTLADTWGLVVNESMASGLPVLGSIQSQAVQELLDDQTSGWVFDATSPASMSDAIERLFATPAEQRARMGERARRRALSVSPAFVADQIVEAARAAIAATARS